MKLNLKGLGESAKKVVNGEGLIDAAEGTAKFVGKHAFKKVDRSFWNGYTGLKETPALKTAAWLGTGAWAYGSFTYKNNTLDKSQTNVTYANEPAATTYDYVSSSAPSLGASGSMVFGLHNGRKG